MAKPVRFTMSDESVNAYGYRVLTAGIDTSAFERNPVGYWNHRSHDEWKEGTLMPLFRWENLKKESGRLTGDCIADEGDDEAVKAAGKMERGFINACSITLDPIEWSEEPSLMLPGQTRPTVTKCILVECSPCGLPGNSNALKLRNPAGQTLSLSADAGREFLDAILPTVQLTAPDAQPNPTSQSTSMDAKQIRQSLGLAETATDAEVQAKLTELKADSETKTQLQEQLSNQNKAAVKTLLDGAVQEGKITEADRPTFEKLAAADLEGTRTALSKIGAPAPSLRQVLSAATRTTTAGDKSSKDECEYDQLSRDNPNELRRLQREDKPEFERLKAEKLKRIDPRAIAGAK